MVHSRLLSYLWGVGKPWEVDYDAGMWGGLQGQWTFIYNKLASTSTLIRIWGVYWQFQSFPLAFVHVTPCRFQLDFLSIFQYDNQWTSDGPLWQLHEVRSAYSACISTQRHGHEKRLLRTIFGGEKVSETSCMFGIEIPGVVAVTVFAVLPLRRRLPVLAVSSIFFCFNQYRQD